MVYILNKTKITAAVCALALTMGIGIPALAAANTSVKNEFKQRVELTDEQKAEFEAKRAEMEAKREAQKAKWDALTDEQKTEIYSMHDQIADLQSRIADKYAEFGICDVADSEAQKSRIEERKSTMRENGEMPMGGHGGKHGRMKKAPNSETSNN